MDPEKFVKDCSRFNVPNRASIVPVLTIGASTAVEAWPPDFLIVPELLICPVVPLATAIATDPALGWRSSVAPGWLFSVPLMR